MIDTMIEINADRALVRFHRFGLEEYQTFLSCKRVPETDVSYDWKTDTYTVSMPSRFAHILGMTAPAVAAMDMSISEHLFDYQQFIVSTALQAKRYAIYADTGLGKTVMFLEWARHVLHRTQGRVLILSPLQIIPQSIEEAHRFYGDTLPVIQVKGREELIEFCRNGTGIGITNYEALTRGKISELRLLSGLVLDESSILKSGGGVIKWNLIKSARGIEYKLSCTATPAPNDVMEYASQASFLEKLRSEGEILWTFFTRDKRGRWFIKPHARDGFYRMMAAWSIYLRNPARYGWHDNLADLPAPEFHEHTIEATSEQLALATDLRIMRGQGMFGSERMGVTERSQLSQIAKGFRYSKEGGKKRVRRISSLKPGYVADLIQSEVEAGHQVLVWTVFDEEGELLMEHLVDRGFYKAEGLHGKMKPAQRMEIIERFRTGHLSCLMSKASMLGFGMNFQHCTSMIFSGWDDSYERFYQAVRRAYRFGQTKTVHVHIPFIEELEGMILKNVLRKKAGFEEDAEEQERFYCEALRDVTRQYST